MKSTVMKLLTLGLLVTVAVLFSLQVKPLLDEAFLPAEGHKLAPAVPPKGIKRLEKVEDYIFEMTNQARQAKGLAPLAKDEDLGNVARAYSNDMLERHFFDHTNPDGLSMDDRLAQHYRHWVKATGENIWSGEGFDSHNSRKLAEEIMHDWMSSPGHRENLLDPDFTHLGVGVSANHDQIRATQEFVGRISLWPWRSG